MSSIESEKLSWIINCESNGCCCSKIKSEYWVNLNKKLWVNWIGKFESNQDCESNREKWVELNIEIWFKSVKVSWIISETRNLLENMTQIAVWCLCADGACINRFFSGNGKGIYVD